MAEEGVHDLGTARQKAALRLGMNPTRGLPRDEDVEMALQEYHRLYRSRVQPQHIASLRQLALEAMRFFRHFSPRLVGGVLDGSAGAHSPVTLNLYPETPEDVLRSLMDNRIPFTEIRADSRGNGKFQGECPGLAFTVDGVRVELCLFPVVFRQQATGRRDRRVSGGTIEEVEALVRVDTLAVRAPD